MAPTKFGLFKSRSREQPEQPSTENLLEGNNDTAENQKPPDSPIPSTSKGYMGGDDFIHADIFAIMSLDDDDDDEIICDEKQPSRPPSPCSQQEEQVQVDYHPLQNQSSGTSLSTLDDLDRISQNEETDTIIADEDASTTHDANSLQFDLSSVAESEDTSTYCTLLKKPKKSKSKEKQLTDMDMWQASNVEVMKNLLNRKMTLDEQIKWEAIANARGLCTLTDTCSCGDCKKAKYLAGISDGDGGLGAAPLLTAINFGCQVQ